MNKTTSSTGKPLEGSNLTTNTNNALRKKTKSDQNVSAQIIIPSAGPSFRDLISTQIIVGPLRFRCKTWCKARYKPVHVMHDKNYSEDNFA